MSLIAWRKNLICLLSPIPREQITELRSFLEDVVMDSKKQVW
jgi:hypothetical protein